MKREYMNVHTNKLHDELLKAQIVPLLVESNEDKTYITFKDDTDMDLVQQIIDEHDPTPLPPERIQEDYLIDLDFRISMIELGLI